MVITTTTTACLAGDREPSLPGGSGGSSSSLSVSDLAL
jgi:hypothetical protein